MNLEIRWKNEPPLGGALISVHYKSKYLIMTYILEVSHLWLPFVQFPKPISKSLTCFRDAQTRSINPFVFNCSSLLLIFSYNVSTVICWSCIISYNFSIFSLVVRSLCFLNHHMSIKLKCIAVFVSEPYLILCIFVRSA